MQIAVHGGEGAHIAYWLAVISGHSIVFAVVLTHLETFKPIWFGIVVVPEIAAFIICRNWILPHVSIVDGVETTRRDEKNRDR